MSKCRYPYVRAWGAMLRSSEHYIVDQIALARLESAPEDAIWRDVAGRWHRFSEMKDSNPNRLLLAAYVQAMDNHRKQPSAAAPAPAPAPARRWPPRRSEL